MTRTATLCLILASISLSAQTTPAPGPAISVTGCVAQVQRDGSTGAKPSGVQATPETAANEANNPDPTGRYHLLNATSAGATAIPGTPDVIKPSAPTTYALRGREQELAKHVGHRVEIAGTLAPPLQVKLPSRAAATAEGTRAIHVTSVKMLDAKCSAKPEGTQ